MMNSKEILVDGCAICGRERKTHGFYDHYGVEPTNAQRLERMKARRSARQK